MLRFLEWSAARGSPLLAVSVFGGVAIPPLAAALNGLITPCVIALMTLVLLRVDIAAAFAHLRRPVRLAAVVAFMLLACPILTAGVVRLAGIEAGIAAGVVIFATGCAATSSPAFARMVALDAELSLLATLAGTLLMPLTAPPIAFALMGVDLAISLPAFMARLVVVVGLPLVLSVAIRRTMGQARLAPLGRAVDGATVWMVVIFGFGVMDGLTARMLSDPAWVAQALVAAFAVNFGLNAATSAAFWWWLGRREALTTGLMSGNRNMALYLAVLPAAADPRVALFFALCQFPLFLSVFLLAPAYRRLVGSPDQG